MKGFWSGFLVGAKATLCIIGGLAIFVGVLYGIAVGLEWLVYNFGGVWTMIICSILCIVGIGIFQGCWVYRYYRKYIQMIKKMEKERLEDHDPYCDYDHEIAHIKFKIERLLSGDYSVVYR